jgi:hypothetical protein
MVDTRYVQYGCGWCTPDGWQHFDASPTLRLERIPVIGRLLKRNASRFPKNAQFGDIVKGLPVSPDSCAGVYCSHVLEHLSLEECRVALRNTFGLLRPGGIFRLVVPDLAHAIDQYRSDQSAEGALEFMKNSGLGYERRPRTLASFLVSWLGNSQHKWMWDFKSLEAELMAAGFTNIVRTRFGGSADPMFMTVEDEARWNNALGVECRRPTLPLANLNA